MTFNNSLFYFLSAKYLVFLPVVSKTPSVWLHGRALARDYRCRQSKSSTAISKRVRIVSPTTTSAPTNTAPLPRTDDIPETLALNKKPNQLPDTFIRVKVLHSSDFGHGAIFSDLPGRFSVSAVDGSQCLLILVFKRYIHVEPLLNCITDQLIATYLPSTVGFSLMVIIPNSRF
jgi:hypothetical protein